MRKSKYALFISISFITWILFFFPRKIIQVFLLIASQISHQNLGIKAPDGRSLNLPQKGQNVLQIQLQPILCRSTWTQLRLSTLLHMSTSLLNQLISYYLLPIGCFFSQIQRAAYTKEREREREREKGSKFWTWVNQGYFYVDEYWI